MPARCDPRPHQGGDAARGSKRTGRSIATHELAPQLHSPLRAESPPIGCCRTTLLPALWGVLYIRKRTVRFCPPVPGPHEWGSRLPRITHREPHGGKYDQHPGRSRSWGIDWIGSAYRGAGVSPPAAAHRTGSRGTARGELWEVMAGEADDEGEGEEARQPGEEPHFAGVRHGLLVASGGDEVVESHQRHDHGEDRRE
jgi:hypothetical protein